MVILFTGIALGAFLFAATFFSAAQSFRQTGGLRSAHIACVLATTAAMTALSWQAIAFSQFTGSTLLLAASVAFWLETGWNRVFPFIFIAMGLALLARIPFGG